MFKNKSIMNLKNEPSIIAYIQILQSNITRMSNHSGIIKASICVIYTIVTTILLSTRKINEFWWITIVIIIMSAILDAYYLALERTYVEKYNNLLKNIDNNSINEKDIYDMKPRTTELSCELLARTLQALLSVSIIGFYAILIIISVLIVFI